MQRSEHALSEPTLSVQWLLGAIGAVIAIRLVLMAVLPMIDTSEPRYAEIARLMAQTGDWITPWFEPGVPFWGKPPLAFWASALSFRLFGYSDFAARLPALLASLGTMALVFSLMRNRYPLRTALMAVLVYASCVLPFVAAGAVLMDAYLTLAVSLSLASACKLLRAPHTGWHFGFWAGLAIGMLAKGPLALVLVFAVLLPWALWHRVLRILASRLLNVSGPLFFLACALPWFVAAEWKTPGFLEYFFVGEHFYRFVDPGWSGDLYGTAHQRPHGAIWLDWLVAAAPWGFVALFMALSALRRGELRKAWHANAWLYLERGADPWLGLLALWALAAPGFFTFSGNILWTYVLPSLPAFAMLLSMAMASATTPTITRGFSRVHSNKAFLPAAMLTPLVFLAAATALWLNPDWAKTEKNLVAYYHQHAQEAQPLYYLQKQPFSARYYSDGTAGAVAQDGIAPLLEQYPRGIYLAVPTEQMQALNGFMVSTALFENRRYVLVYVSPNEMPALM